MSLKNIKTTRFIIWMLLPALCFSSLLCVPEKKVLRQGILMREDQAIDLDLREAEKLLSAKNYRDALIIYETIIKNYPEHRSSSIALYKSARIYLAMKNYDRAKVDLETLIFKFPLSPVINEARFELGRIYMRKKLFEEAKNVFLAIRISHFPKDRGAKILGVIRKVLQATKSYDELVRYDIMLYDMLTDFSAISDLKREIFEIIDTELSIKQLSRIAEKRKGKYPGDLARWKLAKLQHHMGDLKAAREELVSFLKNYPLSEYYAEANDLYIKLSERRAPNVNSIGVLLPLSGPNSVVGEIALRGIWLASNLLRPSKGEYDGFNIVIKDTEGDPDKTAQAFDELVLESNVIGIIGPMLSKPSEVAALKAQNYGVPIILLNQDEDIVEIGNFVFRNFISKNRQASVLARFAVEEMGIRRFAFLYPLHKYGTAFISAFWDELENHEGVEVRGSESYEADSNDFSKPIKRLVGLDNLKFRQEEICKGDDPRRITHHIEQETVSPSCYKPQDLPPIIDFEALVIPDNYEKIIQVAPSLIYHNVKGVQLIGGNLWNSEDIFRENTSRYIQGALLTDAFFKNSKRQETVDFIKKYAEAFESDPDIIASHAFESASVILQAIKDGKPAGSAELKDILLTKSDFRTLSGAKAFLKNRNLDHELTLLIIDGEEIKELY